MSVRLYTKYASLLHHHPQNYTIEETVTFLYSAVLVFLYSKIFLHSTEFNGIFFTNSLFFHS